MKYIFLFSFLFLNIACNSQQSNAEKTEKQVNISMSEVQFPEGDVEKINKSEEQWKKELTKSEYNVLREKGTERAFTSMLLKNKKDGIYVCGACQLPLFSSETKFKSGTGWPSFYQPIEDKLIEEVEDNSYGMTRVEVVCARCDGHLGHVFNDGPKPTGLRYCINGVSLDFVSEGKADEK